MLIAIDLVIESNSVVTSISAAGDMFDCRSVAMPQFNGSINNCVLSIFPFGRPVILVIAK